ncbi:YncE family protein, partial [Bacillus cereus group sp. TH152-1LC]|uniref:YncE family protein n=1 Tax=Bacillus cereus group sp. TH152-1LC TaxID=3018060 RepID=UPI003FA41115|nr:YVTN family beta-propeller repeat-containing protein [Bacillus cereus group sp. TH152-1LC]
NKIYVANSGANTVSVIDGATNTVVGGAISVGSGPSGIGVNTSTNKIYVANSGANTVSVIDGATNTVVGSAIPVGSGPSGIGVNA